MVSLLSGEVGSTMRNSKFSISSSSPVSVATTMRSSGSQPWHIKFCGSRLRASAMGRNAPSMTLRKRSTPLPLTHTTLVSVGQKSACRIGTPPPSPVLDPWRPPPPMPWAAVEAGEPGTMDARAGPSPLTELAVPGAWVAAAALPPAPPPVLPEWPSLSVATTLAVRSIFQSTRVQSGAPPSVRINLLGPLSFEKETQTTSFEPRSG
mmetsp:Transcript_32108/g.74130  ORF Transcript_32108/g.74130 Transcript_32108/m.74130 type:complete len:207 (-) Transcript_32108:183-803(-)